MASSKKTLVVSKGQIDSMIRSIRGVRVMLDSDLAKIYGVPTFRFNEAIKRNRHRFPADFMFQLTREEFDALRSQIAMSKPQNSSQIAMSSGKHRGATYPREVILSSYLGERRNQPQRHTSNLMLQSNGI